MTSARTASGRPGDGWNANSPCCSFRLRRPARRGLASRYPGVWWNANGHRRHCGFRLRRAVRRCGLSPRYPGVWHATRPAPSPGRSERGCSTTPSAPGGWLRSRRDPCVLSWNFRGTPLAMPLEPTTDALDFRAATERPPCEIGDAGSWGTESHQIRGCVMPWRRRKRTMVITVERKITMPIAINRPIGITTIPRSLQSPVHPLTRIHGTVRTRR